MIKQLNSPKIAACGSHFEINRFFGTCGGLSSSHFHKTRCFSSLNTLTMNSTFFVDSPELFTMVPRLKNITPFSASSRNFFSSWKTLIFCETTNKTHYFSFHSVFSMSRFALRERVIVISAFIYSFQISS